MADNSKIPRPPGALRSLTTNDLDQSQDTSNATRKRKIISPVKTEVKSRSTAGPTVAKNSKSGAASQGTAGKQASAPAAAVPAADDTWESVKEELGWSPEDCLNHKLAFKKNADLKSTKEILVQHVKRLRSLGWHLLLLNRTQETNLEETKEALEQEKVHRKDDKEAADKIIQEHETFEQNLKERANGLAADLRKTEEQCSELSQKLSEEVEKAGKGAEQNQRLEADLTRLREQLEDTKKQVGHATELHQHAQKYNSQLQEYNTKLQIDLQGASAQLRTLNDERNAWSEERASLRGTISALEAQLTAAQSASTAAEEARQIAHTNASQLRAELDQTAKQRDQHLEALNTLQQELTRYKECTGKNIENLEREKASKALLENQNKAQVEFNCELQDELAQLRAQLAMSQTNAERQAGKAAETEARRGDLQVALQAAELRIREGEVLRRKLHNTILELKGNIRVFCRVRPVSLENLSTESLDGKPIIQFPTSGELVGQSLELALANGSNQQPASHKFAFDRVFGPASNQEEVFEEISQLVQSALDGYKVCIFAYGQTGSGKTYTMVGPSDPNHRGVIPRAVNQLFEASRQMEDQGWTFEMKASMLEIYNEEVKDLLGKGPPAGKKHQISHDDRGTSVSFVEAIDCKRPEKVKELMAKATRMRSVGATAANEQSSRSHMVFTMNIVGSNETSGQQINGVLNLIDLAGSERLSKSLATGDRLKETQAINKSLSALGDVIMALGSKESHVPFRNSKLTYLLQPCLGGDAKTLMFVNIAPSVEASNESLCSLRFAAKVNATEIGTARRNVATKQ